MIFNCIIETLSSVCYVIKQFLNIVVKTATQQQYLFACKGGLPEEHQLNNAGHP